MFLLKLRLMRHALAALGATTVLGAGIFAAAPPASAHTVVCAATANEPVLHLDIPYKFVLGRATFACGPTPPDLAVSEVCLQYAITKSSWTTLQCSQSGRLDTSWSLTTSWPCPAGVTHTFRSRAKLHFVHGTASDTGYKYSTTKRIAC